MSVILTNKDFSWVYDSSFFFFFEIQPSQWDFLSKQNERRYELWHKIKILFGLMFLLGVVVVHFYD